MGCVGMNGPFLLRGYGVEPGMGHGVRNTLGDISYMCVCHAYVLLFPLLK